MPRILIVDDNPSNTFVFSSLLEDEGFEVDLAANGHEALVRIGEQAPDVVLTDLQMPEMDGNELCRRLADEPSTSALPVIVITAFGDAPAATEAHARQIISKPVSSETLLEAIRTHGGLEAGQAAP